MYENLHNIFDFNQLSTADRISLYNQWRPVLVTHGMTEALTHLERALFHDRATQAMEVAWKTGESRGHFSDETVALDIRVDGLLVGIHGMTAAQRRAVAKDHEIADAADRVIADAFPLGVGAVVNASYVDEAAEVERIVARLRGERAADVKRLHLTELVDELAQAAEEYRGAVDAGRARLTFAEVRKAQRRGLSFLAEVLVLVLARFYDSDNADHVAARAKYLAAIAVHEERARLRRRASRTGDAPAEGEGDGGEGDVADAAPDEEPPVSHVVIDVIDADAETSDEPAELSPEHAAGRASFGIAQ